MFVESSHLLSSISQASSSQKGSDWAKFPYVCWIVVPCCSPEHSQNFTFTRSRFSILFVFKSQVTFYFKPETPSSQNATSRLCRNALATWKCWHRGHGYLLSKNFCFTNRIRYHCEFWILICSVCSDLLTIRKVRQSEHWKVHHRSWSTEHGLLWWQRGCYFDSPHWYAPHDAVCPLLTL